MTEPAIQPTEAEVADALQAVWNEWCSDTGCVPEAFSIHGPTTTRVTADFLSFPSFARLVAQRLDAVCAVSPLREQVQKLTEENERLRFLLDSCPLEHNQKDGW